MKPQFRIDRRNGFWTVDIYYISDSGQQGLFSDWDGFEEPFNESVYAKMAEWCEDTFKTDKQSKRVRRMSYTQFHFASKRDLDWFVLYWSGVDFDDV